MAHYAPPFSTQLSLSTNSPLLWLTATQKKPTELRKSTK